MAGRISQDEMELLYVQNFWINIHHKLCSDEVFRIENDELHAANVFDYIRIFMMQFRPDWESLFNSFDANYDPVSLILMVWDNYPFQVSISNKFNITKRDVIRAGLWFCHQAKLLDMSDEGSYKIMNYCGLKENN